MVVVAAGSSGCPAHDELEAERDKEPTLKADYRKKLAQAVNLDELRKQKRRSRSTSPSSRSSCRARPRWTRCCRTSTRPASAAACSSSCSGPGQIVVKDYYAELPIAIRVTGRYHDIGAFAADIANLSRIVTLNNLHHHRRQGPGRRADDGRHRAHLPLPRSDRRSKRCRKAAQPQAKPGAKK